MLDPIFAKEPNGHSLLDVEDVFVFRSLNCSPAHASMKVKYIDLAKLLQKSVSHSSQRDVIEVAMI